MNSKEQQTKANVKTESLDKNGTDQNSTVQKNDELFLKLSEENTILTTKYEELCKSNAEAKDDAVKFAKKREELKGKISSLQEELDYTKKKSLETEDKMFTLTAEIDALNQMKEEHQKVLTELTQLRSEVTSLRDDAESHGVQFDNIMSERNSLQNENSRLQNEIEMIKNDNRTLKEKAKKVLDMEEELKILRVLASIDSPAIELFQVLKDHRTLDLRHLAMQSGMAQQTCKRYVEKLYKNGLVMVDNFNDINPTITLAG